VYHFLASRGSALVPKLLGYACEQERIVGFLSEMVVGRFPSVGDEEACLRALNQLHSEGIVHGDINKYNIIVTVNGLKFIDLENAIICPSGRDDDHAQRIQELKVKEIKSLKPALDEKSGSGRPYNEDL
jgi:serine/threonine protein kinase